MQAMRKLLGRLFALLAICLTVPFGYHLVQVHGQSSPSGSAAPGRLGAISEKPRLIAGEDNALVLNLHGYKPTLVTVTIFNYDDQHQILPSDSRSNPPIAWASDGSARINVRPSKRGDAHIEITVDFTDGKYDATSVDTPVDFPDSKPVSFGVHTPGRHYSDPEGTIDLDLTSAGKNDVLRPEVLYRNGATAVAVAPRDVKFRVISAPGQPVPIAIDDLTGVVTAINHGHALIATTFEGLTNLTCVAVVGRVDEGGDSTVCQELVPRGMSPPSQRFKPLNLSVPPPQ
jgi:hypothetical protein